MQPWKNCLSPSLSPKNLSVRYIEYAQQVDPPAKHRPLKLMPQTFDDTTGSLLACQVTTILNLPPGLFREQV